MTYSTREAINGALHEIMEAYSDTIMLGEALDTRGGASQLTYGFLGKYGANRVIEMPISENALVGMALGAAVAGLRVVAEVYSADFIFCAGSELINDIAKWRYQHQWSEPLRLVLRMPSGSASNWSGPEHTQSIEGLLQNAPGIRIVVPGTPDDAAAALKESLELGDPVVFLEHRSLYKAQQGGQPSVTLGTPVLSGRVIRSGTDLTMVAWGAMRSVALEAAEKLAEMGVSVEVIDPVTVKPMNFSLVQASLAKTRALLVIDEGPRTGGVAAEVMARTVEDTSVPSHRIRRVSLPDIHHPFDPALEAQVVPNAVKACSMAVAMLRSS